LFAGFLAPIVVEILLQDCCSFSWQKKVTNGSSFFALEKRNKTKKLGTDSGILLLKKIIKLCTFGTLNF
jgi:hypothetical protein